MSDDGFLRREQARESADEQEADVYALLWSQVDDEARTDWLIHGGFPLSEYRANGAAIHAEVVKRMAAMKEGN